MSLFDSLLRVDGHLRMRVVRALSHSLNLFNFLRLKLFIVL